VEAMTASWADDRRHSQTTSELNSWKILDEWSGSCLNCMVDPRVQPASYSNSGEKGERLCIKSTQPVWRFLYPSQFQRTLSPSQCLLLTRSSRLSTSQAVPFFSAPTTNLPPNHIKMHFSTVVIALAGASTALASAIPGKSTLMDRQAAVTLCTGADSSAVCCATDVLGVADLDCAPRMSPNTVHTIRNM
jgi:hypothetical protein